MRDLFDRIGPRFRGLWKSVVINNTKGLRTEGFSCTFSLNGETVETDYFRTPEGALQMVIDVIKAQEKKTML